MKQTQTAIAVALALVVIAVFFIFPGLSPFASSPGLGQTNDSTITQSASNTMPTDTSDQLQIVDTIVGAGAAATAGDIVTVNYVGSLTSGKVFDASASHPETVAGFSFPLGAGQVIKGWDEGVAGMKVGGKRHLVIPATLGYGSKDYGPIPANSTLIFDVELLKITKASQ